MSDQSGSDQSGSDQSGSDQSGSDQTGSDPAGSDPTGGLPPEGPPRAHHDMGGVPKFLCEGIDTEPHALTEFDRTVDALRGILGAKGVMSVDELRRGIEAIPEADYLRLGYYERWMRSIADNLLARGVVTKAELRAALDAT